MCVSLFAQAVCASLVPRAGFAPNINKPPVRACITRQVRSTALARGRRPRQSPIEGDRCLRCDTNTAAIVHSATQHPVKHQGSHRASASLTAALFRTGWRHQNQRQSKTFRFLRKAKRRRQPACGSTAAARARQRAKGKGGYGKARAPQTMMRYIHGRDSGSGRVDPLRDAAEYLRTRHCRTAACSIRNLDRGRGDSAPPWDTPFNAHHSRARPRLRKLFRGRSLYAPR